MKGKLTRREFLKIAGCAAFLEFGFANLEIEAATASATNINGLDALSQPASAETGGKNYGMLVDASRCKGCQACLRACAAANNLVPPPTPDKGLPAESPELVYNVWTRVDYRAIRVPQRTEVTRSVKRQCMHCLDPACASACPVAALYKTKDGPVIYREDRCMGCRYCMMACPFDVPKFEWNNGLTPVIGKCQFCAGRLAQGLQPACVSACPVGALKFGNRAELLAEAKARLRAMPDQYINYVYGEHEVGGTAWLYISDVPFEQLGFRMDLPTTPLPEHTWAVASKIPALVVGLATLLGATAVMTRRGETQKVSTTSAVYEKQAKGGVA